MERYELLKLILLRITTFSDEFREKIIQLKEDNTPVTELDIINQYIFEQSIKYYFTNDIVIAEENLNNPFSIETLLKYKNEIENILSKIKNNKIISVDDVCTWFIDPIDGTKGFIDNLTFSIAVSLLKDDNFYCSGLASIGLSKSIKIKNDIVISTTDNKKTIFFDENSKNIVFNNILTKNTIAISRKHKTKELFTKLHNAGFNLIEMDSQAKYMLVLLGLANYYIREQGSCGTYNDYSWDHLAGIHLIKVNGGYSADINGDKAIYNERNDKIQFNKFLITAKSKKEYEFILEELKGKN